MLCVGNVFEVVCVIDYLIGKLCFVWLYDVMMVLLVELFVIGGLVCDVGYVCEKL